MKSSTRLVFTSCAIVPMLIAAGVVSSTADEARRTSSPAVAAQSVAAEPSLDSAAARALADKVEAGLQPAPTQPSASSLQSSANPDNVPAGAEARTPSDSRPAASPSSASPSAAAKKVRGYQEYVSLGDSWSADVKLLDVNGLPDATHAPIDCAQSQTNYPKLLAKELKVAIHRDATCGSAKTDDFYAPQTALVGGVNPPQFDRLTKTTDLVTIGIGGNDAGIAAAAIDCLSVLPIALPLALPPLELGLPLVPSSLPLGGCKERFTAGGVDVLDQSIRASEPKLIKAIREVRNRSPRARILMVDYLNAVPEKGCYPTVPMTDSDMAYLHKSFVSLNAMVKRAAKKGGAEFVDTYSATVGHDACQGPTTRYVEVLGLSLNGLAIVIPAHPNPAGAQAQYRAVLAQVRKK